MLTVLLFSQTRSALQGEVLPTWAFSHWEIGSFKGGGVWTKQASPEQKMLLGSMKQGRLSWYELDLLMNYITHMRRSAGEEADQVLSHLYNKLDQLKASI